MGRTSTARDPKRLSYKDVTLTQLRSFCEVCRLGSYAAAARELLLTTPAIWEQMQGLERHYGCRLLVRRGNGVAVTTEGEQLLELVRPLLAGLDSTRDIVHQRSGALPTSITVATNLRVLVEEISRGLKRFQKLQPALRLRLIFTGNDVDQRIASGEADVGFTLEPGPEIPCSSAVVYERAGEVDYLLLGPKGHPIVRSPHFTLQQVIQYPLVLSDQAAYSRHRVGEVLHRHDLASAANVVVETSSDEYTVSCVRAGLGLGITVGTGRGSFYRGLAVRSLRRWFGTARLGFLWKRGAHILAVHRSLAETIANSL